MGILEQRDRTDKRKTVIDLSAAGNSAIMCRKEHTFKKTIPIYPVTESEKMTFWRASTVFRGVFFYAMI